MTTILRLSLVAAAAASLSSCLTGPYDDFGDPFAAPRPNYNRDRYNDQGRNDRYDDRRYDDRRSDDYSGDRRESYDSSAVRPSGDAKPEYPVAQKTSNPSRVISPYPPYNVVDVEGFRSGQLARDPGNKKIFRVP